MNRTFASYIPCLMNKPSQHDNHHEDRLWSSAVKTPLFRGTECFLVTYVNDLIQAFSYVCPLTTSSQDEQLPQQPPRGPTVRSGAVS